MTTTLHEESIYTLQRRIGMLRHLPDPQPEPETAQAAPTRIRQPERRTSTLSRLFAWRVRLA